MNAPAETQAQPSTQPETDAADLAGVFDLSHFVEDTAPATPAVPAAPAAEEPGVAVVAPSATPAPAPAPATPTPAAAPAPAPTPAPAADPSASPLPPSATPAPAPTPSGLDPEAEERLRIRNLEATAEALRVENERLKAAPPAAQTPAPAPAGTAPQTPEGVPLAQLTIPDEVTAAIFAEDPAVAKQGLNHLVSSLANYIYKQVYTDMHKGLNDLRAERVQEASTTELVQQRQSFEQDYFTHFPAHNKPIFKNLLVAESTRLAAEFPNAPVDEHWRNALGARVQAAINEIAGVVAPAPAPTPAAPTPAPAPAAMMPADGGRGGVLVPGTEPDSVNSQDTIMSTFTSG